MFRQVSFKDEDGKIRGGIGHYVLYEDGVEEMDYVICGCCGSVIESGDVDIVEEYGDWVDISDEIIRN